jgi:hypothetical protein
MNDAKCILCSHDAQSNVFTEAAPDEHGRVNVLPGEKYDCPECGLFALDYYEHNFVEHFATDNQKEILSDYVKNNPDEDGQFKVLRSDMIKEILNLPKDKPLY